MNKQKQRQKGFTLAEMMIVITIIAIVSVITIRIQKSRTYYETRFMTYSAYMNLKRAAGELLADGYELSPSTGIIKSLPTIANKAAADASYPIGLCQRITDIMNISGSANCTPTANDGTNFNAATANFITTNGQRFYNFGGSPGYPTANVYTVYVDINGSKSGGGVLYKDVIKFTINTNGTVLPVHTAVVANQTAADNPNYMTASVKYTDTSGNVIVVSSGVDFYTATCDATGSYNGTSCATAKYTTTCASNPCEVYINKPGY